MKWIRVEDGLPPEDLRVLTFDGYCCDVACISYWTNGKPIWMNPPAPPFEATHWMPLPELPNE